MVKFNRILVFALLALVVYLPAAAQERQDAPLPIDLTKLLAGPPAQGSPGQKQEIEEMLALQAARTPELAAFSKDDADMSVIRFGKILGPAFTADKLPKTVALFHKVRDKANAASESAKKQFNRPRPFAADPRITPCVFKPESASYPSGHSIFATVSAILLSDMVPEKKAELFARAKEYGASRVIGGVHYPSDVADGRVSGTVIAAFLLADPNYQAEAGAVRAEIRAALGLN
jgi:acid phosphatase (class A)